MAEPISDDVLRKVLRKVIANKVYLRDFEYRIEGQQGSFCDEVYELEKRGHLTLDRVTGQPDNTDEGLAWVRAAQAEVQPPAGRLAKGYAASVAFQSPEVAR